jgi:hypothetical protein
LARVLEDSKTKCIQIQLAEKISEVIVLRWAEMGKNTQEVIEENRIPENWKMPPDITAIWKSKEKKISVI